MTLRINVMRIGELSRRSGVSKPLIHYYLRREYLHPPIFKKGNQAFYDETHLERLSFLEKCKEERVPLSYTITLWQKEGSLKKQGLRKNFHSFRHRVSPAGSGNGSEAAGPKDGAKVGTGGWAGTGAGKEADTRSRIIAVASKTFLKKGYGGTTIAEIMSAVGITKPSFYYYFENKKDLYLACLDTIFEALSARTVEEIRRERDPVRRIEMRWRAALAFSSKLLTASTLLKESLRDLGLDQRRRAESLPRRALVDPLVRDLDRGIKSGAFRPVKSEITGFALLTLIDIFAYRGIIDRRYSAEDILREVFDLIMHGLMKES